MRLHIGGMYLDKETKHPACPSCGQLTYRAAGARALPGAQRAFCLQFRWDCPRCGHEHIDTALKAFNEAQARAIRLMRGDTEGSPRDRSPTLPMTAVTPDGSRPRDGMLRGNPMTHQRRI